MTTAEFVEETSRLEKYYEKELDEFQRKIWNEELGNIPVQRYRQIIKEAYRTCKFMPKLSDLIEINKQMGYHTENKQITESVECEKCGGKGFVIYIKEVDNGGSKIPYEYIARCNCKNGDNFIYNGSNIDDSEHRSNYYVPTINELGF